jgi:hypothetical protein
VACVSAHARSVADDLVSLGGPERRDRFRRVKSWAAGAATGRARVITVAAAVALVVVVPVAGAVLGSSPGSRGRHGAGGALKVPAYPAVTVARIPVGGVVDVAGDAGHLWLVRYFGSPPVRYQLVKLDIRTSKVMLRVTLGEEYQRVAAGAGTVWLTAPYGPAAGRVERLEPATGQLKKTVRLPAGRCFYLAFAAGRLLAQCQVAASNSAGFFVVNPVSGGVQRDLGRVLAPALIAVAPTSAWYATSAGISGVVGFGTRARVIRVTDPPAVNLMSTQSLVFGEGFIWALTSAESVVQIDPATGRVVRVYTYPTYDPGHDRGLSFLAVGDRSLWFIEAGPVARVLRVSIATGLPLGQVRIGSCAGACDQVFAGGALWIPTTRWLIKISPRGPVGAGSAMMSALARR